MNSRPLTRVSDDSDDSNPLTPNHLLLLRGNFSLPWALENEGSFYKRKWLFAQHVVGQFWKRWLREYLSVLHQRQKWLQPQPSLSVGDIVMIADSNSPRGSWPIAKVIEVKPGRDNLVRSARVRTKTTELVRPISKLVFLEGVHYDS